MFYREHCEYKYLTKNVITFILIINFIHFDIFKLVSFCLNVLKLTYMFS